LLTDYVIISKHQKGTFSKNHLKQVLAIPLTKGTVFKKIDKGLDFGVAIIEIEGEEKN